MYHINTICIYNAEKAEKWVSASDHLNCKIRLTTCEMSTKLFALDMAKPYLCKYAKQGPQRARKQFSRDHASYTTQAQSTTLK